LLISQQTSGQIYTNYPQWNVAGRDYAVGVPASITPVDVAVATAGAGQGQIPTGCTYSSGTTPPKLTCTAVSNLTINGLDFSPTAGHNGIQLILSANNTGTITIKNSNFENDAGLEAAFYLATLFKGGSANVVVQSNTFEGHGDTRPSFKGAMAALNTTGNITFSYNAVFHSPGRPFQGVINNGSPATVGSVQFDHNLIYGMGYFVGGTHAEFWEGVGDTTSTQLFTIPSTQYLYNTCVQPAGVGANTTTGCFYVSTGGLTAPSAGVVGVFASSLVDHNVAIINNTSGARTAGAALASMGWSEYTNFTMTNNYVDATGAIYTANCSGAPYIGGVLAYPGTLAFTNAPTLSGNINMVGGASINTISLSNCS
jgi:hypothetical protein